MQKSSDKLLGLLFFILTAWSILQVRNLQFSFDLDHLFPSESDELSYFRSFEDRFNAQTDENFIFIALKREKGILDSAFLSKADSITRFLISHSSIEKVYSPTGTPVFYFKNGQPEIQPLIPVDLTGHSAEKLIHSPEYGELMFSGDGKSLLITAFYKDSLSQKQKDELHLGISDLLGNPAFPESHYTSALRIEQVYTDEIIDNLKKYLLLSLLVVSGVLFLFFRSVGLVLVQLSIIALSVLSTFALMAFTGHPVDVISGLIPPVLAAIIMSDVIHISAHFSESFQKGHDKKEALSLAIKETGYSAFLTCCVITTGFISLSISDVIAIRYFGLFTAAGIFSAYFIALGGIYLYFKYSGNPLLYPEKGERFNSESWLSSLFVFVIRRQRWVLSAALVIVTIAVICIPKIKTDSSLLQEIPAHHPMLRDVKFMEGNFSGTRIFEMNFHLKDANSNFLNPECISWLEQAGQFLKDSCRVGAQMSFNHMLKSTRKALNEGKPEQYALPESNTEVIQYLDAIGQSPYDLDLKRFLSEDRRQTRLNGRLSNISMSEFERVKEKFNLFMQTSGLDQKMEARFTGSNYLLDLTTKNVTGNLFKGLWLDIILLAGIGLLLLRSVRSIPVILIPNLIPVIIMAAIMGLNGILLKADTSVIFAIALAIAADDTIHFMGRLSSELKKGKSLMFALRRTYLSSGMAILVSSITLISGFMILLSSGFQSAYYVGLLIGCCLTIAVLTELLITPILVWIFIQKRKKHAKKDQ